MKPRVDQTTPKLGGGSDKILSDEAIRAHLNRILVNKEFHATDKMRDFLHFVVEETLAGRSRQLKGFTIATEVYGRRADFDAAHDPVVRIQAGRLRRAIERYYLVAGEHDPIRIEIPKGTYVPVFTPSPLTDKASEWRAEVSDMHTDEPWPTIRVNRFKSITGEADLDSVGFGLTNELCVQLGNYPEVRVNCSSDCVEGASQESTTTRFTVTGTIHSDAGNLKVVVRLIDEETRQQLWTKKIKTPVESMNLLAFQENTVREIAVQIASEQGVISRTLLTELGSRVKNLTAHEAILKAYACSNTPSIQSYLEALEALQTAQKKFPHCGLVAGRLAFLYAENIALEFFDLQQTPLEDAIHFAQEGVKLEPNYQMNRLILAFTRMLNDELGPALVEVKTALALKPNGLQFREIIGYMLTLLGQWEWGTTLISEAIRLNPYYRVYVHSGTWLNWFRQNEYSRAMQELELTLGIGGFWDPLARSATLGQLGKIDGAQRAVKDLLMLKPDFSQRGRILIGHYVKSADIADKIVEGLEKAGLNLDSPKPRNKPITLQAKQDIAEL